MPVLISYVDAQCRYRLNNLTYEKCFGRSRQELYGKHMRDVVGDAAFEAEWPDIERAPSGCPVTYERELPYIDAGSRWVQGLFEPFMRGKGRSGSATRSVGLGLYIAKQLVLAHGGAIELTSTEADGTTFSVRLPRRAGRLSR